MSLVFYSVIDKLIFLPSMILLEVTYKTVTVRGPIRGRSSVAVISQQFAVKIRQPVVQSGVVGGAFPIIKCDKAATLAGVSECWLS